jgi:hypothetical protein
MPQFSVHFPYCVGSQNGKGVEQGWELKGHVHIFLEWTFYHSTLSIVFLLLFVEG